MGGPGPGPRHRRARSPRPGPGARPRPARRALEEGAGVDPDHFWTVFDRHRPACNISTDAAGYWELVAADLDADWDHTHRQRLRSLDIGPSLNPREPTVRPARRLYGRVPLAVHSDAPADTARALDGSPGMAVFDMLFLSRSATPRVPPASACGPTTPPRRSGGRSSSPTRACSDRAGAPGGRKAGSGAAPRAAPEPAGTGAESPQGNSASSSPSASLTRTLGVGPSKGTPAPQA